MTALSVAAQDTNALRERIDLQRYQFPQEKIYVMTDRGSYLAGDTIWLRAWVIDAATHQRVDASQFVYVELVSPTDSIHTRVKIHRNADGVFKGYLPLDIDLPEGRYQLTAFTMFMQSVGAEYFYRQPVEIAALPSLRRRIVTKCMRYKNEIDVTLRYENTADSTSCPYNVFGYTNSNKQWNEFQYNGRNKEFHLTLKGKDAQMPAMLVSFDNYSKYVPLPPRETLDVTFYPEGGYLVPDLENVVTFKLTNTSSTTLTASGELRDLQGQVIAKLETDHDGMGIVKFTPTADGIYKACWKDNFDQEVTFDLPRVRPDATVLQVRHHEDGTITATAAGARAAGALVLLQERGCLLAAGYDKVTVREKDLPTGVVQAFLLDDDMRCLSERLFFAHGSPSAVTNIATGRDVYADREQVSVDLDLSGFTTTGCDYAVSVIDASAADPSEGNILANLLLQSDLRGPINQPSYYFTDNDSIGADQRLRHLDMLMLTQGWRRYDIPRVLRGHLVEPQFPLEVSQVVTGRVLSDWRKKPVAGATVSLIAPLVEFGATAVTDSLGEFVIALPLLPDSVDCIVMAENIKGKKQMNLELDTETYPQVFYVENGKAALNAPSSTPIIDEQQWRLEKGDDWRHIILNELLVTTRRPRHASERNPYYLSPNKIAQKEIRSIESAAYALPGLIAMNGGLYTAGGTAKDHVTIFVDGEPIMSNYFTEEDNPDYKIFFPTGLSANLSELSIAQSFISFKDISYIYFARKPHGGGNLYIQHREGYHAYSKKERSIYLKITQPMGAQRPVEFYTPRYDSNDCGIEPGCDLRTTLYWNPSVAVNETGKSTFDFYASDAHGTTYIVTVEGISSDGIPFRTTHNITKR